MCNKTQSDKGLEGYWQIIKSGAQKQPISNIKENSTQNSKAFQLPNITIIQKAQKEEVKKKENIEILQTFIREETVQAPKQLTDNPTNKTYYNPIQTEMFPMSYIPSFVYPQHSYNFLYMLQAQANEQNTIKVNPNNLWLPNAPESIPNSTPVLPHPINYVSLPNQMNSESNRHSTLVDPKTRLLNRASTLPTVLTTPVPRSEHLHIHCEFCGHYTIRHNDHIDYVHDAELHHVDSLGKFHVNSR